ncbi:acyl-coenzyme A synthetase ACSM2A, mitochondrial-like [Trichosurus vulpecula]|uniref:acyl-coenzyme A synthetase ACSM2A, mitochondrial-like n=1 Tax=Trichosurus vulpecula TaxID=9337 RepID=UPI00186B39F7|nr:acyl-coenzyme A synthetase ACSM2A, mitochondrial-like [Trichosurus vulpecula]
MRLPLRFQGYRALWASWLSCCPLHLHPRNMGQQAFLGARNPEMPEKFNFAHDVLDHWAQMEKEGKKALTPALWWVSDEGNEVKWNYQELGDFTRQAANVLSDACGLQRGDRVIVILPRIPEWWLAIVGCIRAGLVFIPGTPMLTAKDILYRLQTSKAKCIITSEALAPTVDAVAPDCLALKVKLLVSENRRDGWMDFRALLREASTIHSCVETGSAEALTIYFTSGTTGAPKMAKHSHGSLGFKSKIDAADRSWIKLQTSDTMWSITDTGWILNLLGTFLEPWISGACSFIHHLPRMDPLVIINTLSRYPINIMLAPPMLYQMLLKQDPTSYKFQSLRLCISSGEALLPETLQKWETQTGLNIKEIYGQTETGAICRSSTKESKPGFLGKAVSSYDIQIIDENGNVLPPGQEGEIGVRIKPIKPIGFFSGYVDNAEKTAANITGNFWRTGDLGIMDQDGNLQYIGRADDVINSRGYRIGPSEVENVLNEHPAVAESAVISSPDTNQGQVVKAFVVLTPKFESHDRDELIQELQQHVKTLTAPYKYPRKVEFVSALPKTITGKIQRAKLRKDEWKQTTATHGVLRSQ